MSLTVRFATLLSEIAHRELPEQALATTALLTLDGIAVAMPGAGEAAPRMLAGLDGGTRGTGFASAFGGDRPFDAVAAARINGAAMHVLDYEPMWTPANHAVSTVLPALLALAESRLRADGGPARDRPPVSQGILTALAIGIEAQARLRLASGQFEPGELSFHPPGVVGPIGAAAACGVFMGLPVSRLAQAIGIAASHAGGILANVGSHTKALHCGQAAASGLESASLAARGFTADADALAGPRGYGRAFYGAGFQPDALIQPVDQLHVVEPGPAFKLFPSQYGTHFAIACALEARKHIPRSPAIEGVTLVVPPMPYIDRPNPPSGLAGKFSFQYTTAVALLDGVVNQGSFNDERRFASDVESLLARIELEPDPTREGRFDRMSVEMRLKLADGSHVVSHCGGPPGIWGNPVSPEVVVRKAEDCLRAGMRERAAATALRGLKEFGELDDLSFLGLMDQLASRIDGRGEDDCPARVGSATGD